MCKIWLFTLPLMLWLGVVWRPSAIAGMSITGYSEPPVYRNGIGARVQPHGIMLADNQRTEEQTGNTDTPDSGAAEKKTTTDKKNEAEKEDKKSKPLKSFVPTEKVKADQTVDFPYDI